MPTPIRFSIPDEATIAEMATLTQAVQYVNTYVQEFGLHFDEVFNVVIPMQHDEPHSPHWFQWDNEDSFHYGETLVWCKSLARWWSSEEGPYPDRLPAAHPARQYTPFDTAPLPA